MEFVEFKIKDMTCDHCAQSIAKKFSGIEGIVSKNISYPAGTGKFEYDPEKISKEEIAGLIDSTEHYRVESEINQQPKIETVAFTVTGMTCDHLRTNHSKKTRRYTGIVSKNVSYTESKAEITFDTQKTSKDELKKIIDSTGQYKVSGEISGLSLGNNQFDLIIIGGGSAAFSAAIKAESLGLSTLMVNGGLDFVGLASM